MAVATWGSSLRRLLAGAAATAMTSCAPQGPLAPVTMDSPVEFRDPPKRRQLSTIAVFAPATTQAKEIRDPMVAELVESFNVETRVISGDTTAEELGRMLDATKPVCIVLLDNRVVQLYSALQKARPRSEFPPALVLMTSLLEQVIGTIRNATGIAYEVPAVSSLSALREVTVRPLRTVGVVYRQAFADTVARQANLARVERFGMQSVALTNHPTASDIDGALAKLLDEQRVDALWILNDNALLTAPLISQVWLPRLSRRPVPAVVGVSVLVKPELRLGTFAVLPDHEELGVQASRLLFELSENGWKTPEHKVELPLRIRTVADVDYLRDTFGLREGALGRIDESVK